MCPSPPNLGLRPNSYVAEFKNRVSEEIIEVKWGHRVGPHQQDYVLIRRDKALTSPCTHTSYTKLLVNQSSLRLNWLGETDAGF